MGKLRDNLRIKLGYYLSVSGMSQKDLADRLGVSQSSVTNWLKGKNSPDIDLIAEICNIFNIEITDLMDIKKSPDPAEPESEEDVQKRVALLTEFFSKAGYLEQDGNISEETLRLFKALIDFLDSYFEK